MKTAILLGAGSSVPAGFPSTRWLTDLVLSGNGVERHSSGSYQITSGVEAMAGAVRLPNCMVRRLHAEAERYFTAWGDRPANYEDIFYLADQARAEVLGEMENPAIRAFVEELRADLSPLVETLCQNNEDPNGSYEPGIPDSFECLVEETNNYIRDVVWQRLCVEPTNTDHLGPLVAACKSGQLASVSTLCHDTHLEKHLAGQGIPLADGFSDEEEGVRYWNENFSSSAIPFLKLHGSLDWFLLRPRNSPSWYGERVGIPLNGDHNHTKGRDGEFQTALNDRPLLLVGTFNKISEYSQGIFRDLHYQFRRTLRRHAVRLAIGKYLLPFSFALHPALLLQGTWDSVVLAALSALLGAVSLSAGTIGYGLRVLTWPERVVLIAGGVMLILPGWNMLGMGSALVAAGILLQFRRPRAAI